ncbi:hypothetical protein [Streptomyces inhibens]|uniref:hypothetical protein n=1 Tax=Streptomyces inhibens TaxID=2293571 RepID=UPI001EE6A52C|nr:hypothetical protein [Streptomyces inhibens]UKY51551.1 hypothetical protein KI385_23890 [Streptomyces inhibens]
MREISRSTARLTEVEVSQLPEVAELATALTTMFNALEISQQRYAARTLMDKSTVSRYLNGRRVATQDFIDRMLAEIERYRGTPVTEETKVRLRGLRLAALKVSDPQTFELENLRNQVDRSHREIRNLSRQQEALEMLLDQREAAADEAIRQLDELRSDWVADRLENESSLELLSGKYRRLETDQEELRDEIARLRKQLDEVNRLKEATEEKCELLEQKLMEAEVALAERLRESTERSFTLSLEEAKEEIGRAYENQLFHEAARLLSLSAAHFPEADTTELTIWLLTEKRDLDAFRLLDDAIRFNSIEFTDNLVRDFIEQSLVASEQKQYLWTDRIASRIATSKSRVELQELYDRWHRGPRMYKPLGIIRKALVEWASRASVSDSVAMLETLRKHSDTVIAVRMLHQLGAGTSRSVTRLIDRCRQRGLDWEADTISFRHEWNSRDHAR